MRPNYSPIINIYKCNHDTSFYVSSLEFVSDDPSKDSDSPLESPRTNVLELKSSWRELSPSSLVSTYQALIRTFYKKSIMIISFRIKIDNVVSFKVILLVNTTHWLAWTRRSDNNWSMITSSSCLEIQTWR